MIIAIITIINIIMGPGPSPDSSRPWPAPLRHRLARRKVYYGILYHSILCYAILSYTVIYHTILYYTISSAARARRGGRQRAAACQWYCDVIERKHRCDRKSARRASASLSLSLSLSLSISLSVSPMITSRIVNYHRVAPYCIVSYNTVVYHIASYRILQYRVETCCTTAIPIYYNTHI